ncbi:hypothetical protein WJR50_19505 [Catalinimonas sp. 4WD22]|uniref:hypothetical protein n=1 Tax=Catalinimonas locisalis TaxID=3133978 RepID=UPI003100EA4E
MIKHFHTIALILLLTAFFGCSQPTDKFPHFSSDQDTLLIATTLHKGTGKFERTFSPLQFNEISKLTYPLKLPNNLIDIKHATKIVDGDVAWYRRHRNDEGLELPPFIIEAISANTLDTTQLPSEEQNIIDIITGVRDSVQVFVLDENNNQDLTDDTVRIYQPMNWRSNENLIKSVFYRYNGEKIIEDSTWVKVGTLGSNPMLFLGVAEYVTADFYLNNQFYQLGTADFQASFTYDYRQPTLVLLKQDSVRKDSVGKDSVYLRDILYPNEFVRLNDAYYQIHKVSKYGDYITLIKEEDFSTKTETQIGIKAPDFTAITTAGDTIISANMHDKPMLIANSCECGGDMGSLTAYYEIEKQYGNKAHIIHIDSGMPEVDNNEGIHIEMEDAPNRNLYNQFRKTYCSRVCYVIDVNNTIIDKFFITDWKDALPKVLNSEREMI